MATAYAYLILMPVALLLTVGVREFGELEPHRLLSVAMTW